MMKLGEKARKEALDEIREEFPLALAIFQPTFDEWILDTTNLKKIQQEIKENYKRFGWDTDTFVYKLSPERLCQLVSIRHDIYHIAIPSLNLFLISRKNKKELHNLLRSQFHLFGIAELMKELMESSKILPIFKQTFENEGMKVSVSSSTYWGLKIEIEA